MNVIHEPAAEDRRPCYLAPDFTSPCSEPATEGVHDHHCDRHEVERRARLCGITPQQWLRNVYRPHLIPILFGESE